MNMYSSLCTEELLKIKSEVEGMETLNEFNDDYADYRRKKEQYKSTLRQVHEELKSRGVL